MASYEIVKAEMARLAREKAAHHIFVCAPETTGKVLADVVLELARAEMYAPFNSMHEAYGVLDEEFDEFKKHVFMNQKSRDLPAMRAELVQVAAMAIKAIHCIDEGRGRV